MEPESAKARPASPSTTRSTPNGPSNRAPSKIAIEAHYEGVETRLMASTPPFVACAVFAGETETPIRWTASQINGYWSRVRRINPQLGWASFARAPEERSPKDPVLVPDPSPPRPPAPPSR